jgi:hydroxymethylbilane synthase
MVAAERAFLSRVGGGCAVPVAAYAEVSAKSQVPQSGMARAALISGLRLTGLVISEDGTKAIKVAGEGPDALRLGDELAQKAITQGASEILAMNGVK